MSNCKSCGTICGHIQGTEVKIKECIVKGCTNKSNQGKFIGDLCLSCYNMLKEGDTNNSSSETFIDLMEKRNNSNLKELEKCQDKISKYIDKTKNSSSEEIKEHIKALEVELKEVERREQYILLWNDNFPEPPQIVNFGIFKVEKAKTIFKALNEGNKLLLEVEGCHDTIVELRHNLIYCDNTREILIEGMTIEEHIIYNTGSKWSIINE